MCVWFPNWPIQRRRGERLTPDRQPLILFGPAERGKVRVTACSSDARPFGVSPGMLLAEAQASFPPTGNATQIIEAHDVPADRERLRQLAIWSQQFSPLAAIDTLSPPDCLLLDLTGCGYGYGGEEGLATTIIDELRQHGYWAMGVVADTVGAAWAVAHFGNSSLCSHKSYGSYESYRSCAIIPPGHHSEAIQPLDVASLRLSPDVIQLLREFDIRQVGQLLGLPRSSLPSRFGPEILLRLDQALGAVAEILIPEKPVEVIEASWTFEPYIADRQILEAVLNRLLDEVLEKLRPRQIGVRRLLCSLALAGHDPLHFPVGLLQPSLSLRHLMDLLRLHLERQQIPAEVMAVTLRAAVVAPFEFRQGQLFDGDDGPGRWRQVAALLERLSSRLGEQSVLRPKLNPDPQPEFACHCEPWLTSPALDRQDWSGGEMQSPSNEEDDPAPSRPTYLQDEPQAIEVVSVVPDGPPIQFHWNENHYVIRHCWGPERIEAGWWRGLDVHRDYYLAETTTGERFWLFRTFTDGRWFMHGVFA